MSENIICILHVEDDSVDAMVVRGTNGKEKLNPLPRYILLDINMPKMNGLEFLKELRNDSELSNLTVFILTTSNDDHDRAEAYKYHVAGYILKPVDLDHYLTTFATLYNFWQISVAP
jgi:CheY-like chemotaxis protein